MAIHLISQDRSKPLRSNGGHFLTDQRTAQANNAQQEHHAAHAPDIADVPGAYTVVDDIRCHNWYNQFKDGFRQFEDRAQDDLQPVILQEACEFSHETKSFSLTYPLFYLHWTKIAIYFAGYFQKTNFFCDILSLI